MPDDGIEAVRPEGAVGAAGFFAGAEHEVIDDQLASSFEQAGQRLAALWTLERILLVDLDPGQGAAFRGEPFAGVGEGFFLRQQAGACGEPFFAGYDRVAVEGRGGCFFSHGILPFRWAVERWVKSSLHLTAASRKAAARRAGWTICGEMPRCWLLPARGLSVILTRHPWRNHGKDGMDAQRNRPQIGLGSRGVGGSFGVSGRHLLSWLRPIHRRPRTEAGGQSRNR